MSIRHPRSFDDLATSVSLAAGAANVIMQLSLPAVGYGVVESKVTSGSLLHHPIKRARTTFTYLAVAIWGTDDERRTYRKAVNASHRQVRSDDTSPVAYNAFDTELQLWVAMCLYRGLEDVHNAMYPNTKFRGEHGIYEAAHTIGSTLQVRPEQWPATRDDFDELWNKRTAELVIDDVVRDYLLKVVDLAPFPAPLRSVAQPINRFLTTGFLPPEFRAAMHLEWSDRDQRRFGRIMVSLGRINAVLPLEVRSVPYNVYLADFRRRVRVGRPLV